jgi:signal transduction histidine kinase
MRQLLGVLRDASDGPELAPQPGIRQIEDLVEQVRAAGIPVSYTLTGKPVGGPPGMELAIYRIVQEALTNIVKYASARNIDVELLGDDEGVSLIVHDDGAGLPAGVESSRLSHGIAGMRQRIRALNGTFKISSRPGSGTTIEVFIPLPEAARQAGAPEGEAEPIALPAPAPAAS